MLLLLDLRVPTIDDLEGLRPVKVLEAPPPVILITAVPEVQHAAHAFELGAADSLVQSFDSEIIVRHLRCLLAQQAIPRGAPLTPVDPSLPTVPGTLVGQRPSRPAWTTWISRAADTAATVLRTGKRGTGQACLAQALSQARPWWDWPVVARHGAAMPEGLVTRPCVGHARSAYPRGAACLCGYLGAEPAKFEAE